MSSGWALAVVGAGVAGWLGACSYEAPSYDDAHFRCDSAHPCPSGQLCVGNVCERAGLPTDAPSEIDADAAVDATAIDAIAIDGPHGGISCGASTCSLDQECCVDLAANYRCQSPGAVCVGVSTRCDGPEDCPGGECCLSASNGECVAAGTCGTAAACHEPSDCSGSRPACCGILMTPWRGCFQTCVGAGA